MAILISGCTNSVKKDVKIKVADYDSFPRLVPTDASLFSYYQKGDRNLKVQFKTLQKVFFVKQRTKPLKEIQTKDLLAFGIIDQERIYGVDSDSIYIYDLMNNFPENEDDEILSDMAFTFLLVVTRLDARTYPRQPFSDDILNRLHNTCPDTCRQIIPRMNT